MFADDLKLFRTIRDVRVSECLLLQDDINSICNWCTKNVVPLNIKNFCSLSFSTLNCKNNFDYTIHSFNLSKVLPIIDLGVIFNSEVNFKEHIDHILAKSRRSLGFLKRNSKEFKNIFTLITLYYSLVRPQLEYCCIIWNPSYNSEIFRIGNVQKNFTRYLFAKWHCNTERPTYFVRCKLFGIDSPECRRKRYSIIFSRDLVHSYIKCSSLLGLLIYFSSQKPLRKNFISAFLKVDQVFPITEMFHVKF